MQLKKLFFVGFLFLHALLNAQNDYRPGYVILNNGDSISGEINYRKDSYMALVCKFKTPDNQTVEYYPERISAYRFINGKYFVSRKIQEKQVFLEYLIKGELNVYYLRNETGDHYYVDKDNEKFLELPYKKEILNGKAGNYFHESKKYTGMLMYYMRDAANFQLRIKKLGKPSHRNLTKLAEDYHHAVCEDGVCIVYEKKQAYFVVHVEPSAGLVIYEPQEYMLNSNRLQAGVLLHVWLPRINEKLFFKTGAMYSSLPSEIVQQYRPTKNQENRLLRVPIQVEYIYFKGIIRPKFALGADAFFPFALSFSAMLGINIKITKSVFASFNYDFGSLPPEVFPIYPKRNTFHSFTAGLYFNFKKK